MTRDSTRPGNTGAIDADSLLPGLWEEAPFARLPGDAPEELKEFVEQIRNPKRVYAISRASRRHNLQLLVQKYIVQLREGCGAHDCATSTCFSCRRRIAGRAPIRRYNPTSARTLAVYLASQDNAENGLCPNLKLIKAPPAALNSLLFVPRWSHHQPHDPDLTAPGGFKTAKGVAPRGCGTRGTGPVEGRSKTGGEPAANRLDHSRQREHEDADFVVVEEDATTKDYRSFAANLFGTVALKMLEWLTPSGVEEMMRRADGTRSERWTRQRDETSGGWESAGEKRNAAAGSKQLDASPSIKPQTQAAGQAPDGGNKTETAGRVGDRTRRENEDQARRPCQDSSATLAEPRRRLSQSQTQRSSTSKAKRQLSIDAVPHDVPVDESPSARLRSPRSHASYADKRSKVPPKKANGGFTRPISQLSASGFFDDVKLETMPPPKSLDPKIRLDRGQVNGVKSRSRAGSPRDAAAKPKVSFDQTRNDKSVQPFEQDTDSDDDLILPQSLTELKPEIVEFLCDVMHDDDTAEAHLFEPSRVKTCQIRLPKDHTSYPAFHRRLRLPCKPYGLRREWKLFVEQSFFYVLSDPQLLLRSFTSKGQLHDTQTLWYCFMRMIRVAPSVVFHSLWMAAARLFAPPRSLQGPRSPTAKLFPKLGPSLSTTEAGFLMSICLHALIAAAPVVNETSLLHDISRIRSHGLRLDESGVIGRAPTELCLLYEDAFSDDLVLRLAKRLFTAITARNYFDDLQETYQGAVHVADPGVLNPLFSQLDLPNMDAVYVLDFKLPDRTVHEVRAPILLLDWARTVMLHEWDGDPEVPGDGSFGGALAMIDAFYKKRHVLCLADGRFRFEYLAERLDEVAMPVAWLAHTSSKQKRHLLDYPYLFDPATLVSYFRGINFVRMSRAHEEASAAANRMNAITAPESLITDPYHKTVLQKLLKTAASPYLILDIRRESVLEDAFDQLWHREERELTRPLKVHLGESSGEEGFDSGGVQQEFFRLAIAEALDPAKGCFTVDERTRMSWFQPSSPEPAWKFEMVGMLLSLAVYNGLTLPMTFPKALYRKLLGEPVTDLHHIADGWPDLASGLTQLVDWDESQGSVENVFARTYEFSVSIFGHTVTRRMRSVPESRSSPHDANDPEDGPWPQFGSPSFLHSPHSSSADKGSEEAPLVTKASRNAYVGDYIRYLTDLSIRPQYEAFARGFRLCLAPKSLTLLTPTLLQSLVEGVQDLDVSELRRYTRYVGWDASHRTVRDFWSIVRSYDDTMRRRLLEFVTASDRLPVGGVPNLQFVVQRNGEEGVGGHLPTAYTCYGTLLLPEYSSREVLRERLEMALSNAQGFGFA